MDRARCARGADGRCSPAAPGVGVDTGAFAAVIGAVAVPVGALVVPALADWAPGTATPLATPRWRVAQAAATVVAAAGVAVTFGPGWRSAPVLVVVPAVVALSAADIVTRRLPDRLMAPTAVVTLAALAIAALAAGRPGWPGGAAIGAIVLGGFLFVMHLTSPAGMGFGDVKFGAVLGALLGWITPVLALGGLLAASVLGAVVAVTLALVRRDRHTTVPFGPFLAAGTIVALVAAGASGAA